MRKKTGSQVRHRRWGRGRQLDGNCSLQLSSLETTSAELSSPGATPAVAKRKNVCSSNLYGQMYISLEETHKTKLFPISLHRTEPQRALGLDPNVWPREKKKHGRHGRVGAIGSEATQVGPAQDHHLSSQLCEEDLQGSMKASDHDSWQRNRTRWLKPTKASRKVPLPRTHASVIKKCASRLRNM